MSETLYTRCAEVLAHCQAQLKDDLPALLDPASGFAPQLRQICTQCVADLEDSGEATLDELSALKLESNTWGLLQALIPLRKTDPPAHPTARALLSENPYTPPAALAHAVMAASRALAELVVVREWLHDTAPQPLRPDVPTGYWKFTKLRATHALRTAGSASGSGAAGIVSKLDPDAVVREDGRALAADDANHEKMLAQALFAYVRAGRLDDAVELCRKMHQPWRAASLRGAQLFQWKAISTEPRDDANDADDAGEDGEQDDAAFDAWHGNRRRGLWKAACTRAALDPRLPDTERALYASLAPSPRTAAVLQAACRTWEDTLWARIGVLCEERASAAMERLRGAFWEGGAGEVARGVRARVRRRGEAMSEDGEEGEEDEGDGEEDEDEEDEDEEEEEEWREEVKRTLQGLASVQVEDGLPADNAFHMSQLHIILDSTEHLLDDFASRLQSGLYDRSASEYPTMTRFFAHLCLFLQMIDLPASPLATQVILEAYLRVLEDAGQRHLIAMYAGALGDNAVERYALFLTSLGLSAAPAERRLALTRARAHGLDPARVAVATAERTIERAFDQLPNVLRGPLPVLAGGGRRLQKGEGGEGGEGGEEDAEVLLVRSIEWTVLMEATYETALEQANVILRYLLAAGRVQVAAELLALLPPELASIAGPEERATEHAHYRQFFAVWAAFERALACQAREGAQATRDARAAWLAEYAGLVDETRERVVKLLTTDWLVPEPDAGGAPAAGERRLRELARIRQIYVPELVLRLHVLLLESRARIPQNAARALALATLVADSRYRLYEDFALSGHSLAVYLGAVRTAVLAALEHGGSDPFMAVAA